MKYTLIILGASVALSRYWFAQYDQLLLIVGVSLLMIGIYMISRSIEAIDDTIRGHVIRLTAREVTMLTEEGFELTLGRDEVIVLKEELPHNVFTAIDEESLQKDSIVKKKRPVALSKKDKLIPPMEVDLHIEKLVNNPRHMTNYEMLTLQIETARRQLEFAIAQRRQRVVFIHGVGEGVLRIELETLLGRYNNITFYDAEYAKYGIGATEVYIYQNAKE